MDEIKSPAAFLRSNQRQSPKGVININRKRPKIEKYNKELPVFAYNLNIIDNEPQLEMPPTEE